jgi:hypothetical protein
MGIYSIRTAKNERSIDGGHTRPANRHRRKLSALAAQLESGGLWIINMPMGQELIAELNSFEVDFTSAGNMRVDVRSKDHHGDLVIATALALWSAVGRPSGQDRDRHARKLVRLTRNRPQPIPAPDSGR